MTHTPLPTMIPTIIGEWKQSNQPLQMIPITIGELAASSFPPNDIYHHWWAASSFISNKWYLPPLVSCQLHHFHQMISTTIGELWAPSFSPNFTYQHWWAAHKWSDDMHHLWGWIYMIYDIWYYASFEGWISSVITVFCLIPYNSPGYHVS
jgi:hypothetical protein